MQKTRLISSSLLVLAFLFNSLPLDSAVKAGVITGMNSPSASSFLPAKNANGTLLHLRRASFDPIAGLPNPPRGLSRIQPDDEAGLRLVQFPGPINRGWYQAMSKSGLDIISYLPDFGYLVWGNGQGINRLKSAAPVRWSGPYQPYDALHPKLSNPAELPPQIDVIIQVYDHPGVEATLKQITGQAASVLRSPSAVLKYRNLAIRIDSDRLDWLASFPDVVNIEPLPAYQKLDEVQDMIMAGELNGAGTAPTGPGYLNWLIAHGFPTDPAAYPIIDVTDDGIDDGSATPLHADFYQSGSKTNPDRLIYNYNWTSESSAAGIAGHGNLNAAIAAGYNDLSGVEYEDINGYNYGIGVNPYGRVAGSKVFCDNGNWCLLSDYNAVLSYGYAQGTRISSNSWGSDDNGAYTTDDQTYDSLVRDAQVSVPGNQEMTVVVAAGNYGYQASTTGSPANAKNVISVGAAESARPTWTDGCGINPSGADSAMDIINFSSRGPTMDGRVKPDIMAPGTHIIAAASQDQHYDGSGVCDAYYPEKQTLYAASSGTSHSTPAISGAASLIYRYYQDHFSGIPSPAMIKAYLLNSTRYLNGIGGGGNLPTNSQGYGEINLGTAFDSAERTVVDQNVVFNNSGQATEYLGNTYNPAVPFRVTLAWTDAPGSTIADAYVNNLDLEVEIGGQTYKGNVFSGEVSITGGLADNKNNVESVYLPAGTSGPYTVRVKATNIAGDGVPGNGDPTDQDFALVIYNGSDQHAHLDGVARDAATSQALSGVQVEAITNTLKIQDTTDATGYYTMSVPGNTYNLNAWKYGYDLETVSGVQAAPHSTLTTDFNLHQTDIYQLSGCVTDAETGEPLQASITVLGPLGGTITQTVTPQSTGCYLLFLHGSPYQIIARAQLHQDALVNINMVGDTVQDLALTATTLEGLLWGKITSSQTGDPIPGALIQASPLVRSSQSLADGSYEMLLPPGIYNINVTAPLYGPYKEENVVIHQSNLSEHNYVLHTASLAIVPPAMPEVVLESGEQSSRVIQVQNSGQGILNYSLSESTGKPITAGPDPFGYSLLKTDSSEGVQYEWIDATTSSFIQLGDDDATNLSLPFIFNYYGTSSSFIRVGNNGAILFNNSSGGIDWFNTPFTSTVTPNMIAPLWDDLATSKYGGVYYSTRGSAPNRQFIVEWYNLPHWSTGNTTGGVTFEVIFYEGTNNIKFQYQDINFNSPEFDYGASATVGIRQSGNNLLQYSYNTASLVDGIALCFQYPGSPGCDPVDLTWLSVAPSSGSVDPSGSQAVTLTFSAGTLPEQVYPGFLRFRSNDPEKQPYIDYPISLAIYNKPPQLSIVKTSPESPVQSGAFLTYTISVINSGGLAAGVTVSDSLPVNTSFSGASMGGTESNGSALWSGLNILANSRLDLSLRLKMSCMASGTIITNDHYQVFSSNWLTPTTGSPLSIRVVEIPVKAGFTFSMPVLMGQPVVFNNQSQGAYSYAWDFGDEATSTATNPLHGYAQTGPYTTRLIATGYCGQDSISLPVQVEDYKLQLGADQTQLMVKPGETFTYTLVLTNTGTLIDSYQISLPDAGWATTLPEYLIGPLLPGESASLKVSVQASANAYAGSIQSMIVLAASQNDSRLPKASASIQLLSQVSKAYRIALSSPQTVQSSLAGRLITYTVYLLNAGNITDTFDLSATGSNSWIVDLPASSAPLGPGQEAVVQVYVQIPNNAKAGEWDAVIITAKSQGDPSASTSITLITTVAVPQKYYLPLISK